MLSLKGFASFFTHAITIISLFTYSVCDEKVKMTLGQVVTNFTGQVVAICVCVCVCVCARARVCVTTLTQRERERERVRDQLLKENV